MGRRLVGHLPVGETTWRIKPPYKLFVDELDLPRGERENCRIVGDPEPRSDAKANSSNQAP